MFGAVYAADGEATDTLIEVAREFSPRIEIGGPQVVLDLSGSTRLFGDARATGEALLRTAADRGLRVRVAMAGTRTAARLLALSAGRVLSDPAGRQVPKDPPYSVIVVDPGTEAAALAPLPIDLLAVLAHDDPRTSHLRPHRRTVAPSHPRTS